jgi:hypothetical protein
VTLALSPLSLQTLQSPEAYRRFLRDAIRAIEAEAARCHRRFLGRAGVLRQNPLRRARKKERTPRPPCHTSFPALLKEHLETFRAFVAAFRSASERWRRGEVHVVFPEGAYRPFVWPLLRRPKLAA